MGNPLTIFVNKVRFLLRTIEKVIRYVSYFILRKDHLSGRVHKELYSTVQYSAVQFLMDQCSRRITRWGPGPFLNKEVRNVPY